MEKTRPVEFRNPHLDLLRIEYKGLADTDVDIFLRRFNYSRLLANIKLLEGQRTLLPENVMLLGFEPAIEMVLRQFDRFRPILEHANRYPRALNQRFKSQKKEEKKAASGCEEVERYLKARFERSRHKSVVLSNSHITTYSTITALEPDKNSGIALWINDGHIDYIEDKEGKFRNTYSKANFITHLIRERKIVGASIRTPNSDFQFTVFDQKGKRYDIQTADEAADLLKRKNAKQVFHSFDVDCIRDFNACTYSRLSYLIFLAGQDFSKLSLPLTNENDIVTRMKNANRFKSAMEYLVAPVTDFQQYAGMSLPIIGKREPFDDLLRAISIDKAIIENFDMVNGVRTKAGGTVMGDVVEFSGLVTGGETEMVKQLISAIQ